MPTKTYDDFNTSTNNFVRVPTLLNYNLMSKLWLKVSVYTVLVCYKKIVKKLLLELLYTIKFTSEAQVTLFLTSI